MGEDSRDEEGEAGRSIRVWPLNERGERGRWRTFGDREGMWIYPGEEELERRVFGDVECTDPLEQEVHEQAMALMRRAQTVRRLAARLHRRAPRRRPEVLAKVKAGRRQLWAAGTERLRAPEAIALMRRAVDVRDNLAAQVRGYSTLRERQGDRDEGFSASSEGYWRGVLGEFDCAVRTASKKTTDDKGGFTLPTLRELVRFETRAARQRAVDMAQRWRSSARGPGAPARREPLFREALLRALRDAGAPPSIDLELLERELPDGGGNTAAKFAEKLVSAALSTGKGVVPSGRGTE